MRHQSNYSISQITKIVMLIHAITLMLGHENGKHMIASSVVKEVGTKVAQFTGYNNLRPEQVQM